MKFSKTMNLLSSAFLIMGQVEGALRSMSTEVTSSSKTVGKLFDTLFDICEYDSADIEESNLRARTKQTARAMILVYKLPEKVSESRRLMNRTSVKIRFEKGLMSSDDVLRRLQDHKVIEISCIVLGDKFEELNNIVQMEIDEFKTESDLSAEMKSKKEYGTQLDVSSEW